MFSKNDKAALCFLAPLSLSLCISSFLFFLSAFFFLLIFPKIGRQEEEEKKKDVEFVSSRFYFTWEEKEEEREDSLGWCCGVCPPHFLVALLLLSVGHKVTTQDSSSQSVAAWSAEFCPEALPQEAISPFCSRFWSVNQPDLYSCVLLRNTEWGCNEKITIYSYFYLIISNYPKLNYPQARFCNVAMTAANIIYFGGIIFRVTSSARWLKMLKKSIRFVSSDNFLEGYNMLHPDD